MAKYSVLVFALLVYGVLADRRPNCLEGCTCNEESLFTPKMNIRNCEKELNLTANTFANIPSNVTIIYFESTLIDSIEKDAFKKFEYLEIISFNKSAINRIHPLAFNIEELSMVSFCDVKFVEMPYLKSESLEELIFYNTDFLEMPKLDSLPSLGFLNLSRNKISVLEDDAFAKLLGLKELVLSQNQISKIGSKQFEKNTELNFLSLDDNPIKSFKIDYATNLENLSLRGCELTEIDQSLTKNMELLTYLDVSHNKISILRIDVFEPLKSLNNIDLSNNLLVELDDDIFAQNNLLDKIVLDNNNFSKLPKFKTSTKFEVYHFSCANCSVESVDGVFDSMTSLVTINLSKNKIENLNKKFFKDITGLKYLDLSNNNIQSISLDTFENNLELEILNLSGNRLLPLNPRVFAKNAILLKLDISNNSLLSIWSTYDTQLNIERLSLANNNINTITLKDLSVTENLKLIELDNNPLKCTNSEDFHGVISKLVAKNVGVLGDDQDLQLSSTASKGHVDSKSYWIKKYNTICHKNILEITETDSKNKEKTLAKNNIFDFDNDNDNDNDNFSFDYFPLDAQSLEEAEEDEDEYLNEEDQGDDVQDDENDENDDDDDDVQIDERLGMPSIPYMLSLTSIFIITAVAVLCMVLTIAILILRKKNPAYGQNSPRFRIPQIMRLGFQEKTHSGTVYKTLTEEFEAPRHSIYEFK